MILLIFLATVIIITGIYCFFAYCSDAYLGAQGAIAFLLAVVHDTGAANSLAPAIERSVGITLGIAAICLISLLWPTTTKE